MVEITMQNCVSTLNHAGKRLSPTHQLLLRWLFKTGLHAKPADLVRSWGAASKMMQTQTGRGANNSLFCFIHAQLQIDSTVQRTCADAHGKGYLRIVPWDLP